MNTALGTNVVDVVAWDSANNYATNKYQVVITNGIPTALQYDANGNLTNQYTSTYTNSYDWDGEDRLVRVTRRLVGDPIQYKTEFLYDGLGRRSQIIERTNGVVASSPRLMARRVAFTPNNFQDLPEFVTGQFTIRRLGIQNLTLICKTCAER